MADRSAAEIFSQVIARVGDMRKSPARDSLIADLFEQSTRYDFHPRQMSDAALTVLVRVGLVTEED